MDGFLDFDSFGVRLQSDFFKDTGESLSQRIDHAAEELGQEETWRTASNVKGIDVVVGNALLLDGFPIEAHGPMHTRGAEKFAMIPDLAANSLYIGAEAVGGYHTRMEIAVGTLGLTERYLNIDAEISHRPKTLA